jgi:DNA polymerase III delta subunit
MLILHGTNIVASRKVLVDQKKQARQKDMEIIELSGPDLDLVDLKQALESASLFGQDRLVVIENFFSRPKSKLKEEILAYLKTQSTIPGLAEAKPRAGSNQLSPASPRQSRGRAAVNLILWEGKQIDGRVLRGFTDGTKIQAFKLPAVIFKFLDSIQPGSPKLTLNLLHQTLKTQVPEVVFYMLARRTKDLLIAKDLGKKGLVKLAPWQQGRLLHQTSKFSLGGLLVLHQALLRIDWEQKTGQASLPLASTLDLLVASL